MSVPLPVVPVLDDAPFGLGADAAGFVVGLGGVAELVGGGLLLSGRSGPVVARPVGDGVAVCDVGVHATNTATTSEAAAARRRACVRSISQLLRNGEMERHGDVANASRRAKRVHREASARSTVASAGPADLLDSGK